MRALTNGALAALAEQLMQRVAGLIRDFEHDAASVAAEELRSGYMRGYQEASHEIRRDDE
jgi:hypothetical protein